MNTEVFSNREDFALGVIEDDRGLLQGATKQESWGLVTALGSLVSKHFDLGQIMGEITPCALVTLLIKWK